MNKIIALANQKGGVGKTTTTLNFGFLLAQRGYRVLLVDFDAQGNLTINCGVNDCDNLKETIATPMYQIIQGAEDEADLDIPVYSFSPGLDFIPSNVTLSNVNLLLTQAIAREHVLKHVLQPLREQYDFILIDCAPSLGLDLINALVAADEVLIITNPSRFSSVGTKQLLTTIERIRRNLNEALRISGVLINRVDRRTNFHSDIIDVMRTAWGHQIRVFQTEISSSIRVDEAQSVAMPLETYEADNKTAMAFRSFVDEYLEEVQHE